MKLADWLKQATERLEQSGIGTARLDALVLLEDTLRKDRTHLLAQPDLTLEVEQIKRLEQLLKRRIMHEPLAYIRGKSEFYGREFIVSNHTLEPRPETETMIEFLKTLLHHKYSVSRVPPWKLVDVGTGSGCLAITAKLEFPVLEVVATDIDTECLKVAHQNAKTHGANIKFLQGDLLEPIISLFNQAAGLSHASAEAVFSLRSGRTRTNGTANEYHRGKTGSVPQGIGRVLSSAQKQDKASAIVLLANLPYVPDSHTINEAAMFEPKHAIFGGEDGLDLYRRLFEQIKNLSKQPQYILTESLPFQHQELTKIAKSTGYNLQKTDDFIQIFTKL